MTELSNADYALFQKKVQFKLVLLPTLFISVFILVTSFLGIFNSVTYARETKTWWAQCVGQDWSNIIFIVPLLFISAIFSYRGSKKAYLIWLGALFVNIYSFVLYCFAVHFNYLFLIYCAILGLSNFVLIINLYELKKTDFTAWFKIEKSKRFVAGFVIFIATVFVLLWLSEALPASIANKVPVSISDSALITNPVHVLDFTLYLPLMFIAGILLWRRKALGYALSIIMLIFALCTGLNIMSLMIVSTMYEIGGSYAVSFAFGLLGVICACFTIPILKAVK